MTSTGQINREMVLESGRLDRYIEFGKSRYAIEAKRLSRFSDAELKKTARYLNSLNLAEGYMPVFDSDKTKPWAERIWREDKSWTAKPSTAMACDKR